MSVRRIVATLIASILLATVVSGGQASADFDVTISTAASANGTWTGNVWNPDAAGSNVSAADIQLKLAAGDVSISTSGGGAENGDISINSSLTWSENTLTLTSGRDVQINAVMTASNTSALTMNTAQSGAGGTVRTGFAAGGGFRGRVDFDRTGTGFLLINGADYTVITSLGGQCSTTATDLQGINGGLGGNYALGKDIDASATALWEHTPYCEAGFLTLGNDTTHFTGVFDGLGHTVSGVYVINTSFNPTRYSGLFYVTDASAALRNIGLVHGSVFGTGAGSASTVYNYSGGLVGFNGGSITNAYNTGNVMGRSGGVTGLGTSYNYSGGLVGSNGGSITNVYSTGSVSGISIGSNTPLIYNYSGGLVGSNSGSIANAYFIGSVSGISIDCLSMSGSARNFSGGLVGSNSGSITNAYNSGSVSGRSEIPDRASLNFSGGVAGANTGSIINVYSSGSVFGHYRVGGLVGSNTGPPNGTASNSFWDSESSGLVTSQGGAGKTTAEMKSSATFAGWDSTVWKFYDGHSYPLLKNFLSPLTVTANNMIKEFDAIPYSGGNGLSYSPAGVDATRMFGGVIYTGSSQGAIAPGSYVISPGGFYSDQQGYDISYGNGTLAIGGMPVSSVLVDPSPPTTIYAAIDGAGIYKSTDSGTSWNSSNGTSPDNLTNLRVKALERSASGTIYAATYGGGVFMTTDGGSNWSGCGTFGLNLKVVSLTIDSSGILHAGTEAGVFMSENGCSSWAAMNSGLPN